MGIITDIQGGQIMGELKKQLPFAIAKALNDTAFEVVKAEKAEMKDVFDNPTPYVLNSARVFKRATKQKHEAVIEIDRGVGFGKSPATILGPHIIGGSRPAKRSEEQLREKGYLDSNMFWAPGQGARLNKYGNISGPQIVQILSALKSFREAGYNSNYNSNYTNNSIKRNKKSLAKRIFVQKEWGKTLIPGVYERTKTGVKPLLIFLENPQYEKERFDFFYVGQSVYDKQFENKLNEAIQYALATAK